MNVNHGVLASQFDYDALVFLNTTGITTPSIRLAINYLVFSLKVNGIWSKLKAIYPFVGGTAATHKFNLKDPRDLDVAFRLFFSGGWTHSSTGALPNGTNAYANTFLIPSTQLSLNDHSFGIYSRTNNLTGNRIYGALNAASFALQHNIVLPPGVQGAFQSGNTPLVYTIATTSLFVATRTSSTVFRAFRAGAFIGSNATVMTTLPNINFYFGARNQTTVFGYTVHQLAFGFLGGGLTDAEAAILYTIVQNFQTILARQV
jgi:hypothetical protein